MNELDQLTVHGDTPVGWCEHTPPNETMDEQGKPTIEPLGFSSADPRAPKRRVYDDPEVQQLREHLRENNGLSGVEICNPDELDYIAAVFYRDGFVVVRDLLDPDTL
ncbi:MAG: hypothetical protein AAF512_20595 [Pseudomonadota bacterium]